MADDMQQMVDHIVRHLAGVLATTSGEAVRALPAIGALDVDWQVPVTVSGRLGAALTLGVTAATAQRVTAIMLGAVDTYGDIDLADTLHEVVSQAAAAYVAQSGAGLDISVGAAELDPTAPPAMAWKYDLAIDGDDPPRVAIWVTTATAAAGHTQAPTSTSLSIPTYGPAAAAAGSTPQRPGGPRGAHRNLDVVLDLELPITVRFGETRLTLDALARLGVGSLIDLERAPDDPVELLVNGRLVARGEVVVVSGCYGVRVSEVVSAADRLRSLEG